MAFKHGHGYSSRYVGPDSSAREEFARLTDLARELQTTIGYMAGNSGSWLPLNSAFGTQRIGFVNARIMTPDVEMVTSSFKVRYGGLYRVSFQGTFQADGGNVNMILRWHINGSPAQDQISVYLPNATLVYVSTEMILRVNDGEPVDIRARSASGGGIDVYWADSQAFLIGNRL